MRKNFNFLLAVLICILSPVLAFSQSTSWKGVTSANWGTASNWTAGVPTATVDAILGDASFTGANQPSITKASNCKSLTIGGGGKATVLTISRGLTVAGNITVNSNASIVHTRNAISLKGNWTNNGSYAASANNCNVIFAGAAQLIQGTVITGFRKLTINTGSVTTLKTNVTVSGGASILTVSGELDLNESPTYKITTSAFTVNTNGIVKIRGALITDNFAISGASTLNSNSIIEYASTTRNQVISSAFTYSTLRISGSTIKSLAANLPGLRSNANTNGNIEVVSGTLDLLGFTANRNSAGGGSITVNDGAVLKIGGANTVPANYLTVTFSLTSLVEYNGLAQTVGAYTYGNLKLSSFSGSVTKTMPSSAIIVKGDFTSTVGTGTGVSYSALAGITVSGQMNIGANTSFNGGSSSHSIAGNWTNNGTFTGATSTITLSGGGALMSGAGINNFYNLVISGSNITASTSAINITGDFSTISPGSFTHLTSGTLTMSGATNKTISGTGISLNNIQVTGIATNNSALTIAGNISVSPAAASLTSNNGNIQMSGSAKTLGGGGAMLFGTLQVTGTVTASSGFSISKSLDVSGSFTATSGIANFTGASSLNGTANLYNVTINATALTLSASSVLGVSGTLLLSGGTLDVTTNKPNTVVFNGTGAQTINNITYHNLTLSGGGTKTAANSITVNGNLTINASTTFAAGNVTHSIYGNWVNNGTFNGGTTTGVVQLLGATNTSITGATTFNILTISKTSSSNSVSLLNNVSVTTINMNTGNLSTGTAILTITNTRTGPGIITGTITRIHSFSTGISYAFESPDNLLSFTSMSGVTSVTVNVAIGNVSDFPGGAAINRVYTITIPGATYTGTLQLHYEDAELNGNTESGLRLYQNTGAAWSLIGNTSTNTISNYVSQVSLSNMTNRWTLSSGTSIVNWNGSISSDWNTAANWTPAIVPLTTDVAQLGSSGFVNQPQIGSAVFVKSIFFGSTQAVNLSFGVSGSLTTNGNISGNWSAAATHTISAGDRPVTVNGDLILSNGTVGRVINLNAGAGTININGSLIQSGGANIIFSGNETLSIKNDYTYISGTFTPANGTVVYNGTAIQGVGAVPYYNVTINKATGIANVNSVLSVNGNLAVISGGLDVNANTSITGNVIVASGATMYGDGSIISLAGNWLNSGTFDGGTGTVILNGSGAQSVSASTFNNLTINKASGSGVLTGNISISNNLSLLSGNFDLATFTANRSAAGGQLTVSNGASLLVGGANNFPKNFSINNLGNSSTVHYNGSVTQIADGIPYGNIVFSNGSANAKTLTATATVNGDITINNTASFNASSFSINLAGNWTNNGTFIPGTSTLLLNGTGKTISGNTVFNKVTVSGSYSVSNYDITFNGALNVTSTGSYTAGSGLATLNSDLTNSGILTSAGTTTFSGTVLQTIRLINAIGSTSTGVVNFNGSVAPEFNSTSKPAFYNVNINNIAGINPSKDWLILGNMTIGAGASFNGGILNHIIKGNFTNNGTLMSTGTIDFEPAGAVTLKLAGTNFTSSGVVIFGGSAPIVVTGSPTSLYDVRIANTNMAGVSPASGWNITHDFIINNGAIFNAGSYSYTVSGDILSNGPLIGNSSTFTMNGTAARLNCSSNTTFNHFVVNGNVSAISDFNVQGNFTNSGTFDGTDGILTMTGNNAATINGSYTAATVTMFQLAIDKQAGGVVTLNSNISEVDGLEVRTGTLFTSTRTISEVSGAGEMQVLDGAFLKIGGTQTLPVFSSVQFEKFSTVDYAGVNQTISAGTGIDGYGNLTLSTAGIKQPAANLTVQNNVTITASAFQNGNSNLIHKIGGNWIMTSGTMNGNNTTIEFNGTTDQDISSVADFNNLTINKLSGLVTLSSDINVAKTLNMAAGKISIGNYDLNMSATGTITNANANNYIIAEGTGTLNQQVSVATSRVYPVGLTNAYTPATIVFTSGSVTDIIKLRMLPDYWSNGTTGAQANSNAVNATWMISEAVTGGSIANISLQWPLSLELPGFSRGISRLTHYSGSWDYGSANLVATGTNPYSVTRTGFTNFSPFGVSNLLQPFPVSWLSINGMRNGSDNVISWTVTAEMNNDYFVVEMSVDGNSYTDLGRVAGAGTTGYQQQYHYTHHTASGTQLYYRIRQVDLNGRYTYSRSIRIESTSETAGKFTLLGNPVSDKVILSVPSARSYSAIISIVDGVGRTLYRQKVQIRPGSNLIETNTSNQASGIYYLALTDENGGNTVTRFVKK
jgi:fibronectin-binding autotransporter adhesin